MSKRSDDRPGGSPPADSHTEESAPAKAGFSRRNFLASVGAGTAALAIPTPLAGREPPPPDIVEAGNLARVTLRINGRERQALVEPRASLVHVLREQLGLTAAKEGCGRGECGACTVLMDDQPRYSCMTLAVEAEGADITTLEGLMEGEQLGPTQQAFLEEDAFQCGYCTPGQIMATQGLLEANPDPTLEEIRMSVSGNLCRCGAYAHIFKAASRAAELRREKGGQS